IHLAAGEAAAPHRAEARIKLALLRISECRFLHEKPGMAEGVGLLPTNRKALKINGRFRRYVCRITVQVCHSARANLALAEGTPCIPFTEKHSSFCKLRCVGH